ncbi:MAG: hypothetical protein WAN16_01015, partial [Chthoniobacterales bacterium]
VREEKLESNDFLHFVLFVCFVVPSVFNPDPPANFPPFLFLLARPLLRIRCILIKFFVTTF